MKELDLKIEDDIIRRNFQILIDLLKSIEQQLADLEERVTALEGS